jgi:tetratricopeptide (TPR) repeat protein
LTAAVRAYRKLVSQFPDDAWPKRELAECLYRLHRDTEADEVARAVLSETSGNGRYRLLGAGALNKRDYPSIQHLSRSAAEDGAPVQSAIVKTHALAQQGAVLQLEEYLSSEPHLSITDKVCAIGEAYYNAKSYDRALEEFYTTLLADPLHPVAWHRFLRCGFKLRLAGDAGRMFDVVVIRRKEELSKDRHLRRTIADALSGLPK